MSKIDTSFSLTIDEAEAALHSLIGTKLSMFLWGPPGIGKSDLIRSIARKNKWAVREVRLGQIDPTDIKGIPFFNADKSYFAFNENTKEYEETKGTLDWAPPSEFPDAKFAEQYEHVLLFLDEMNVAAPTVQAAAYQLVLDRRVGKYKVPDNVIIVAAGNRDSDKGVTYRMPSPLSNRFIHMDVRPDFAVWQNWAVQNNIHKDVVGYLSFAKNDMYDFDGRNSGHAFATPRSWCAVSKILQDCEKLPNELLTKIIAGTVGDGLAVKFMAHRKLVDKMPDPMDILEGKVTELQVKEVSAMYSLTVSMCYELKDMSDKNKVESKKFHEMCDNFFKFMMDNFETELVIMGARIALKTYKLNMDPTKLKTLTDFHKKYGKYIKEAVSQK